MTKTAAIALITLLALPASAATSGRTEEPERVTVQHILIAFRGSLPDPKVTRSMSDAERVALEIFERAKAGEDFAAMVKSYTNDSYPGIYKMANTGVVADRAQNEYPRSGMVKAFGDVAFRLNVGEVGLAVYDPATSKYGWHIIKRLE